MHRIFECRSSRLHEKLKKNTNIIHREYSKIIRIILDYVRMTKNTFLNAIKKISKYYYH